MYSIMLMVALGNGAATPAWTNSDAAPAGAFATHGQRQYRHGHGCCGCWGGGYGYGCCGCWGGWGYGCYGCYGGCWGYGCYGCWGGGYAAAGPAWGGYYAAAPVQAPATYARLTASEAASFTVTLPAEAKLLVDDHVTKSQSETRQFVTPPLEPGKVFYYNLTAQLPRNGQVMTVSKRITLQAGQKTHISLDFSDASVARR